MIDMSAPSKELAVRGLRKVGMSERLVGVTMSGMAGNAPFPLYSLQQVANFLGMNNWRGAMSPSSRASVAYIDPGALKQWVSKAIGDEELAQAIAQAIDQRSNYMEQVNSIGPILQLRMRQYESVLAETDD